MFVDSQNRITATGYNGNIRGLPHCIDSPCPGVDYQSGTGLDLCEAQHAESNCVIQNKSDDILTVYTYPCTPCFTCAKMLANSKVKRVVARELYAHTNVINLFKDVGIQLDILGYNYETPNNGL